MKKKKIVKRSKKIVKRSKKIVKEVEKILVPEVEVQPDALQNPEKESPLTSESPEVTE